MRSCILGLFLCSASLAGAQQSAPFAPAVPNSGITLQARVKLAVVDVVVTDHYGNPVHNLAPSDFHVTEDGIPQLVKSFDEFTTSAPVARTAPPAPLPEGTYSNRPVAPPASALNIILIDDLNTPFKDQPYLHDEIVKYLGTLKPGANLAIFALNARITMLQGFTSDARILNEALARKPFSKSVLLSNSQEQNTVPYTVEDRLHNAGLDQFIPENVISKLQNTEDRMTAYKTLDRSRVTLDGLDVLARYLAGFPGRKNLIWFSGSFPVHLLPKVRRQDIGKPGIDPFSNAGNSEVQFRKTANLLARSQVAIYPIDSRGIMGSPVNSVVTAGFVDPAQPFRFAEDESDFTSDLFDEHSTMQRMADQTGGKTFVNTNAFAQAITSAFEDGANYYTVSYSPNDQKHNGGFHKIKVTLDQPGYRLSYRHGYWASGRDGMESALLTASVHGPMDGTVSHRVMAHGVPESTQLIYRVRIVPVGTKTEPAVVNANITHGPGYGPVKPPYRRYMVQFGANADDFAFTQNPDGSWGALLQFMSIVYDRDGRPIISVNNATQLKVNKDQYKLLLTERIPFSQEISVPVHGDFSIRTGVFDLTSSRAGTFEIPVALAAQLPPLPADKPTTPALKSRF